MNDPTEISQDSKFASLLKAIISIKRPEIIIETGTFRGEGSTSIIASTLKKHGIESRFFSLEVNQYNWKAAYHNLKRDDLDKYVNLMNGLSVPRSMIPSADEISKMIADARAWGMQVDHEPIDAVHYYAKETGEFDYDDLLMTILSPLNFQCDFALLDSGGHLGFTEFIYFISLLKSKCIIATDDTKHLKHYRSLDFMKKDPRFKMIVDENEKYGFAIAQFDPSL